MGTEAPEHQTAGPNNENFTSATQFFYAMNAVVSSLCPLEQLNLSRHAWQALLSYLLQTLPRQGMLPSSSCSPALNIPRNWALTFALDTTVPNQTESKLRPPFILFYK